MMTAKNRGEGVWSSRKKTTKSWGVGSESVRSKNADGRRLDDGSPGYDGRRRGDWRRMSMMSNKRRVEQSRKQSKGGLSVERAEAKLFAFGLAGVPRRC